MGSAHGMYGGGERSGAYRVLVEKPDGKSIFMKQFGGHGLDRSGSGLGQLVISCDHRTETLGSLKCEKFLD